MYTILFEEGALIQYGLVDKLVSLMIEGGIEMSGRGYEAK
jgi:hypothetical protein